MAVGRKPALPLPDAQPPPVLLRAEVRRKAVPQPGGSGERVVLEGVRLALRRGEIVALLGPSGCGKTTLLRILAGLDRAFEGEVVLRHHADGPANGEQRHLPRLAAAFQEPRLLPWRTVRQNLSLVRPPDPEEPARLLAALGLPPATVLDAYPRRLSLGMARRVSLARALAVRPDLLLLDEPFTSLDPGSAARARDAVLEAWRMHGFAAVLVTHDAAEAEALSHRVLRLSGDPARLEPEQPGRLGLGTYFRVAR